MKDRSIVYIIPSLFFLVLSCKKEIKVDLNEVNPRIVIEAKLSDRPESSLVTITQTAGFNELNDFPPVSDAFVQISDGEGTTEVLSELKAGMYAGNNIRGIPGRTYSLEVSVKGKTYTASCKMPEPVSIDSLKAEPSFFGKEKMVNVYFKDPAGVSNYYRVIEGINNLIRTNIFILEDRFQDGSEIEYPLLSFGEDSLATGDTVSVFLQAIDKSVYEYFRTLSMITGDGQPSDAPANPSTNISGGALGYFNAYAVRAAEIIIP